MRNDLAGKEEGSRQETYSALFVVVSAIFIASLIAANITAVKLTQVMGLTVPVAIVIFPISYIVGDVLTEVYGYSQARKVIWLGFSCNLLAVGAIYVGQILPPAPFWDGQEAYERILGYAPRLLAASFVAYLAGEFMNAYVLARMKVLSKGRFLWMRTIGSTLVGQGFDSLIFLTLAFAGTIPLGILFRAIVSQWLIKTAYEALMTPVTYLVVFYLKRQEGLDVYDHQTRFNPFLLRK